MQSVQGLTRLVAALQGLNTKGGSLADRLESEAAGLATEMESTNLIIDTVAKTRQALREVNQAMNMGDNGGPPGPLPGSPAPPPASPVALPEPPATQQAANSQPMQAGVAAAFGVAGTMQPTPIGAVFRPDPQT